MKKHNDHFLPSLLCLTAAGTSALAAVMWHALRRELDHRTQMHLVESHQEMAMANYENLRCQHQELMALRQDMLRHFQTLSDMDSHEARSVYLSELLSRNGDLRPVVESGNATLDTILNSKLCAAADAGIQVQILRAAAPAQLRVSEPDLCSLVLNVMDHALSAAAEAETPFVRVDIHEKAGFLVLLCENSFAPQVKKETVPKHGLGLKLVHSIVNKYEGMIQEKSEGSFFSVEIAIALD